jgi:hypothetical protein
VAQVNYLSFQPAFDVFHTQFRFLRLRRLMSADNPWRYQQLRIADFYLLFFSRLQDARLSPKHRALKKLARTSTGERYEHQPDDQLLFGRMERIQSAAAGALIAKSFFDSESFRSDLVVETAQREPARLAERIDIANSAEAEVLEAIQSLVTDYSLLGPDGLKARTGLMEYRYDAI